MKPHRSGFTLVEVLVTLTIIIAVAGLGAIGIQCTRQKAKSVVEINAARNLIAAYLSYAADHNGQVLAGYQTDETATNLEGELLHFPINARYPWRLAPNVPKIEGVMLYNGRERALEAPNRDYLISSEPNMGINATLVGGHFGSGSPLPPTPRLLSAYGKFYLSHLAECDEPAKLIVFASARSAKQAPGYFEVRPPTLTGPVWSGKKFEDSDQAADHGFVDFRWSGKAAVAMLGGNVELRREDELRDMRYWSNQALRANDPNFKISPGSP
jgi:prepilin-type N-terminal cleavage/methylation domain-containing protein